MDREGRRNGRTVLDPASWEEAVYLGVDYFLPSVFDFEVSYIYIGPVAR